MPDSSDSDRSRRSPPVASPSLAGHEPRILIGQAGGRRSIDVCDRVTSRCPAGHRPLRQDASVSVRQARVAIGVPNGVFSGWRERCWSMQHRTTGWCAARPISIISPRSAPIRMHEASGSTVCPSKPLRNTTTYGPVAHSALVARPGLRPDEASLSYQLSGQGGGNAAQLAGKAIRYLSGSPYITGPRTTTYKASWYANKTTKKEL